MARIFQFFCIHFCIILIQGARKLMDRAKSFSHVHLRRAAEAELGGGPGRGPRRGDSGPKRGAFRRGFGFEFGLEQREPTTPNYPAHHFANLVLIFKGSKCDERTRADQVAGYEYEYEYEQDSG